jgi:heat shock protein HslJ
MIVVLAALVPGRLAAQAPVPTVMPSPSAPQATGTPSSPDVLPEGTWQVVALDPWSEGLVEPDSQLTVSLLEGGRLEGATGCGRYQGGYAVDGEQMGLGIVSPPLGACARKAAADAAGLTAAFDAVTGWRAADGTLELVDADGGVRLRLARPAQVDPLGRWVVRRYARVNGTMTRPSPDRPMEIDFAADGSVTGTTGCRMFEGSYTRDGDRLTVGPIELLGPACQGAAEGPERRLLRLMGQVVGWRRTSDVLTLTDAFDQPIVELRTVAPAPVGTAAPADTAATTAPDIAASQDGPKAGTASAAQAGQADVAA